MNLAPLQLVDYFVHSLKVEALSSYDGNKASDLDIDALKVTEKCFPLKDEDSHRFAVDLVIKQDAIAGKNLPYSYELHMLGYVQVQPGFPEDKMQRAVDINGPSMLFGAAREILRAATGRGPYGPLLVPSTTFFKPAEKKPVKAKKAVKKRSVAKA